ncbi:NTF2-like protein [Mycena crocata]|nr:NTF2-like protein [Mycena crocata]
MSPPSFYDPNAPAEQPVALPSAPLLTLREGLVLQPPLTRRGTGPGLIAFVPPDSALNLSIKSGDDKPLDPVPVQKWAEEGFAVFGITTGHGSVTENLKTAVDALLNLKELDTRDKFAVAVYDSSVLAEVVSAIPQDSRLVCLIVYGYPMVAPGPISIPTLAFLPSGSADVVSVSNVTFFKVDSPSQAFVLPQSVEFDTGSASIAHSKAAVHIKKYLDGPFFDLEAIWEEHTYFEFEARTVAKTMGTMVAEPYVNHVPTLAGGIGRKQLSAFYRDHFIFNNPKDTRMQSISRTVGADRVVDEFIFHATHDKQIDWLLPGVPPTGKKIAIPMLGVINIRGDRLYHEHIWWDQGTACMQTGIIPTHVPLDGKTLRLPIAGVESAALVIDERAISPNKMLGPAYGFVKDL